MIDYSLHSSDFVHFHPGVPLVVPLIVFVISLAKISKPPTIVKMQSSSSFHSFRLFISFIHCIGDGLSRTNTMPKRESRCKSRCTKFFHFIPSICSFHSSIGFVDSSVRELSTSPPPFFRLLLPRLKPFSSSESNRTREYSEYYRRVQSPSPPHSLISIDFMLDFLLVLRPSFHPISSISIVRPFPSTRSMSRSNHCIRPTCSIPSIHYYITSSRSI